MLLTREVWSGDVDLGVLFRRVGEVGWGTISGRKRG